MHLSTHSKYYDRRMQDSGQVTEMIHLECHVCSMTATCVVTPSTVLAWQDHMAIHVRQDDYSAWTWSVVPLPGF